MQHLQGKIITSTSALDNSWFEKAVILITEYNHNGAVGFVINKLFERKLNALQEFKDAAEIDLFFGGPVGAEHLYFLHRNPELFGGTHIAGRIYLGGDFNKAVTLLTAGKISVDDVKIFIGYCGWDAAELEAEIAEGSWELNEIQEVDIFKQA